MSGMIEPYIGGNHIQDETPQEHVEKLRSNRTIVVVPVNDNADDEPRLEHCETIEAVFKKFNPKAALTITAPDGSTSEHTVGFAKVPDFNADSLVDATPALRQQKEHLAILSDLQKQLAENVKLRQAVDNDQKRQTLIACLQQALNVLQNQG